MLKVMFEQFVSEYDIYPYTTAPTITQTYGKMAQSTYYVCRSIKVPICFSIEIDTTFEYPWNDILTLVHSGALHILSIKVF